MSADRNLEQLRLEYAIKVVGNAKAISNTGNVPKFEFAKYAVRTRSLPAMVMQSGLHQALLFCKAKAEADYTVLYEQISDWLTGQGEATASGLVVLTGERGEDVLLRLASNSLDNYLLATRETLALLLPIRRLAKAFEEPT